MWYAGIWIVIACLAVRTELPGLRRRGSRLEMALFFGLLAAGVTLLVSLELELFELNVIDLFVR